MGLPPLDIRPFQAQDVHQIRQLVADSQLPPESALLKLDTLQLSRLSNSRIYLHPITLAVYGLCLAVLTRWSGVLRTHDWGRMVLFTASMTAGFLIAGEWFTRTHFEAIATDIVKKDPSLDDVQRFFGKDKFLVATLGEPGEEEVIGMIGLQIEKGKATIRHWNIKAKYRNRGLGWDLVEGVLEKNPGTKKHPLKTVECETYNLQARAEKSLKAHGFKISGKEVYEPGLLGLYGIRRRLWVKEL